MQQVYQFRDKQPQQFYSRIASVEEQEWWNITVQSELKVALQWQVWWQVSNQITMATKFTANHLIKLWMSLCISIRQRCIGCQKPTLTRTLPLNAYSRDDKALQRNGFPITFVSHLDVLPDKASVSPTLPFSACVHVQGSAVFVPRTWDEST